MKTLFPNLVFLMLCGLLAGCTGGQAPRPYSIAGRGDARQGRELIRSFGCGACHIIPGVHEANGLVGPPLLLFGRRTMIAGELPNSPDNLARWIRNPKSVEPRTAMPDLGLTADQAQDVAAYLYTLR
jgi:cytochrome c1